MIWTIQHWKPSKVGSASIKTWRGDWENLNDGDWPGKNDTKTSSLKQNGFTAIYTLNLQNSKYSFDCYITSYTKTAVFSDIT